MKKYLSSTFLLICFLSLSTSCLAQIVSGKAYYTAKSKVNLPINNKNIPEDRKQRMMKFMNDMSTNNFVLTFDLNHSNYAEVNTLEEAGNNQHHRRMGMMKAMFNQSTGEYYKDTKTKIYINKKDIYGKSFLIEDSLDQFDWQITDEVKMIGNYTCVKAKAKVKQYVMPELPFNNQHDEKKERPKKEDLLKEVDVEVWFTLDISVSQGPDKYWGLPGLVLEVKTDQLTILCTKIELDKTTKSISIPKGGKQVNQNEFDKIMSQKTKEVREQMKNRQRGGFRHGGRH